MTERCYVVGDLHLGAGPGDPLEDFRDDDAFAKFCERIAGPETTLVLNGDIVDFAQIPPFDVPKAAHLLWPEAASLLKVELALAAHRDFFAGLEKFVAKGGRVRALIGNHDLDLVWPSVQLRIGAALGMPPHDQLEFIIGATRFHGVHIEHGHHFTPENCPRVPDNFVYDGPGGVRYVERVWGTDFMLQFYNDLERRYPFADNVKPMLKVVWHGLRQGWIGGRELARLFLFLKGRGLPWQAIWGAVLSEPEPLTPASAAAAFEDLDWKAAILERASTDDAFMDEVNAGLAELEPAERRLAAEAIQIETVAPEAVVRSATLGLFRDDRELRAAEDRLGQAGVTHVVFGHTHTIVDGALDGRLFNYGTWLPSLDLKSAHVTAKIAAHGLTLDMLGDHALYAVDRRVVRIDAKPPYQADVRLVRDDEA